MKGKVITCKLKSKQGLHVAISCCYEWHVIVSIDRKGDGSDKSFAGRRFHDNRNKNKDIGFVIGSLW